MGFYQLTKKERTALVLKIQSELEIDFRNGIQNAILKYFSDTDTYIRKSAYESIGRIYFQKRTPLSEILQHLNIFLADENSLIRQTVVNAAGEIAKKNFESVEHIFETGLFDKSHRVRNAVIGSMKKSGAINPKPVLGFAKKFAHHPDVEVRRQVCHGIELRGRTHPDEIMPLLQEWEFDPKVKIRNMVIHVISQISYKKGCLEKVLTNLKGWKNRELVEKALEEIIQKHYDDAHFVFYKPEVAEALVNEYFFASLRSSKNH